MRPERESLAPVISQPPLSVNMRSPSGFRSAPPGLRS